MRLHEPIILNKFPLNIKQTCLILPKLIFWLIDLLRLVILSISSFGIYQSKYNLETCGKLQKAPLNVQHLHFVSH